MEELFALITILSIALPILGITVVNGDVTPAPPSGIFGVPDNPEADGGTYDDPTNEDWINDWIQLGGNTVLPEGTNFAVPEGDMTYSAWNDPFFWRNYDTTQDITVGGTGVGSLSITTGTALRYEKLLVGDTDGSIGTVVITGPGAIYTNDPTKIPSELQRDLNLAQGVAIGTLITDIDAAMASSSDTSPAPAYSFRANDGNFDVIVGKAGNGILQISNGAVLEVGNRFIMGQDATGLARCLLEGNGSVLTVRGSGATDSPVVTSSSLIGDSGAALLTIDNNAVAYFNVGVTIGSLSVLQLSDGAQLTMGTGETLTNNGLVIVESGAVQIDGDITNNGLIVVRAGATLEYTGTLTGDPVLLERCSGTPFFLSETGLSTLQDKITQA